MAVDKSDAATGKMNFPSLSLSPKDIAHSTRSNFPFFSSLIELSKSLSPYPDIYIHISIYIYTYTNDPQSVSQDNFPSDNLFFSWSRIGKKKEERKRERGTIVNGKFIIATGRFGWNSSEPRVRSVDRKKGKQNGCGHIVGDSFKKGTRDPTPTRSI